MINSVRDTVLSILNKNNYGYISPADFNLFAKQAQLEVFSAYFKELNQIINAENGRMSGTEYADLNKGTRESIDVFSRTVTLTQTGAGANTYFTPSQATTNDDYYLINKVLGGGVEAERVTHGKITLLNSSLLTSPSAQYPAYILEADRITLFPNTITGANDVTCQYIRYPRDPKWTFSVLSNGEPVFNQSLPDYQDFEVPIDDETDLVYRILQMAGLSIREGDVYQYANAEEAQN